MRPGACGPGTGGAAPPLPPLPPSPGQLRSGSRAHSAGSWLPRSRRAGSAWPPCFVSPFLRWPPPLGVRAASAGPASPGTLMMPDPAHGHVLLKNGRVAQSPETARKHRGLSGSAVNPRWSSEVASRPRAAALGARDTVTALPVTCGSAETRRMLWGGDQSGRGCPAGSSGPVLRASPKCSSLVTRSEDQRQCDVPAE